MSRTFRTTGPRGLAYDSFPFRLWQKAKRFGVWDPAAIDFRRDAADWRGLSDPERDLLLRLTALFQGGEEAVTLDLLPLIGAVAADGRLEEEMYLTSFLWEEAKHVEFFRRFLDRVTEDRGDLSRYHTPSYLQLFGEELPRAMGRLTEDRSPVALAEASVTYNMIVEGVLAETGYHGYYSALRRRGVLAAMQAGITEVRRDESRHLGYGVYLLSRLVAEHGDPVWDAIEAKMNALLPLAVGVIVEAFAPYDPIPFDLELEDFTGFAMRQFQSRFVRIERAREQDLAAILGAADLDEDAG
jgi:ribonucleoside-diphosphate reductase beta chain